MVMAVSKGVLRGTVAKNLFGRERRTKVLVLTEKRWSRVGGFTDGSEVAELMKVEKIEFRVTR